MLRTQFYLVLQKFNLGRIFIPYVTLFSILGYGFLSSFSIISLFLLGLQHFSCYDLRRELVTKNHHLVPTGLQE